MSSPERPHMPEGRERTESVIKILQETAEQFRALRDEADQLLERKDAAGYRGKLTQRANLVVGLPDRLADALQGIDQETKRRVLGEVTSFAAEARGALDRKNTFGLDVLLVEQGSEIGDSNYLEQLIESLESR